MLKLEQMNDAQREAVMHGEGPLLVLAGPGSGKTFTITQRILYLIKVMQVPPEEILVITFTKDAARSMQQRFLEQSENFYPVNFGTFHSIFYSILKKSNPAGFKVILQESHKKNLLLPILKNIQNELQSVKEALSDTKNKMVSGESMDKINLSEVAANMVSAISYYKNTLELEQATEMLSDIWRGHFEAVFKEYETIRRQKGALDFDDMVYECRKLLSTNEKIRTEWQNRFSHILMDEFQDINPMQYKVIWLLTQKPYNLFAVGDDDQAIYSFRGSKPACMKQFVEEYNAKRLLLNINYRSTAQIVRASSLVIKENKERFLKNMISCKEQEKESAILQGVRLLSFQEREEQYQYLIRILEELDKKEEVCEEGYSKAEYHKDSHAILFRTNSYMQGVAVRLKRSGISFEIKGNSTSIY
ncbi:MAG: ATP-dependent helicase, partial [Lachnospiraceae bacterium]|nr:ATP-dependent helicase [Lachnospiraceae bacterium]